MSSLLTPRRTSPVTDGAAGRPLAVNAAFAALAAVGVGLSMCWVVALAAWFASDGGAHGESTSALKVGSGAWLLAHGADLHLDTAVVTAVPLGLTLLCGWLMVRSARWAGRTSQVDDLWSLALATVVTGGTYGCLALATAVLTTTARAAPDLMGAFVGGALLGGVTGGVGLVLGSGHRAAFRALLPGHVRAALFGGMVAVLAVWAAGAVLAAVAVAWRGESVANVLARLHVDVAGGVFSLLLVALIAPNLAAWGSSYLLGGGFALGTGTVVAPSGVAVGPVPAVPVLAAVPDPGPAPGWALGVLAVPVVCGLLVGWSVTLRFPCAQVRVAVARAAAAAVLGALTLTAVAAASGGAIGGGRMTRVGPDVPLFLLMATAALTVGAATSAFVLLWWQRRHGAVPDAAGAETALEPQLPWRDREAAGRRADDRRSWRRGLLGEAPILRRHRNDGRDGGRDDGEVPGWARLGVWGASSHAPGDIRADHLPGQRPGTDSPDGEDTTFLSR